MNRYAQLALEVHLPSDLAHPIGDQIQSDVTTTRDQILGPRLAGESLEDFRLRSYQALGTAEELILADHTGSPSESDPETESGDPMLTRYYRDLAAINETIHSES